MASSIAPIGRLDSRAGLVASASSDEDGSSTSASRSFVRALRLHVSSTVQPSRSSDTGLVARRQESSQECSQESPQDWADLAVSDGPKTAGQRTAQHTVDAPNRIDAEGVRGSNPLPHHETPHQEGRGRRDPPRRDHPPVRRAVCRERRRARAVLDGLGRNRQPVNFGVTTTLAGVVVVVGGGACVAMPNSPIAMPSPGAASEIAMLTSGSVGVP
jgi:hypothetical protein